MLEWIKKTRRARGTGPNIKNIDAYFLPDERLPHGRAEVCDFRVIQTAEVAGYARFVEVMTDLGLDVAEGRVKSSKTGEYVWIDKVASVQDRLRKAQGNEDGQSLVEFAVTLPVLLLVVTGLMAFGITFNNYLMLTEATSVAARQLTVSRGQTLDPCQTVSSAFYAAAPLLKPANLTFSVSLNGTVYPGVSCSGTSTSGAPANMVLGTNAVLTVTYPFSLNLYGIRIVQAGSLLKAQTTELMQ